MTKAHLVHVHANHSTLWTNFIGGKENVKPGTAPKVNDSLSLLSLVSQTSQRHSSFREANFTESGRCKGITARETKVSTLRNV